MTARARGLREARGSQPLGARRDAGSGRRYVLAGGGHTEPDGHLAAGRRPKVDRPGGRGRGVGRAGTVGGSPGDPSSLRPQPGRGHPRVPPFVTTSVSGPAGPGAGGRAPPARAGAALPDTPPGPRRSPPAALTMDGKGRGRRSGGCSRERAPVRRHRGHPARVLGRAGGRAAPSGQPGNPRAGRCRPRTQGAPRLLQEPGSSRRSRRHAGWPGRPLRTENSSLEETPIC